MEKDSSEKTKRVYEKPKLRTIELVADEVLAVGCKTKHGVRGFGNPGPQCRVPRRCYAIGS